MVEQEPSGRTVARDLMLERITRIRADTTVREARRALVALQADEEVPRCLLVVDEQGVYLGILTGRLLLKPLLCGSLPAGSPWEDAGRWQEDLLDLAARCETKTVRDVLTPALPAVAPTDGLAVLIRRGAEHRMEYLPVVEDGRPLGVVPITAVFTATAALALRPDDEGIQLGEKRVK